MTPLVNTAINAVRSSKYAYFKYLSPNDTGATRSHQAGFYLSNEMAAALLGESVKLRIKDNKPVEISWQGDEFTTPGNINYYSSKNECHLTSFGQNFPFRNEKHIGDIWIFTYHENGKYEGFVLSSGDDIEDFFLSLNLSPTDANKLITHHEPLPKDKLAACFAEFLQTVHDEFPSSYTISNQARFCHILANNNTNFIIKHPDKSIIEWVESEYDLFRKIELKLYGPQIVQPFPSLEELIAFSQSILQRRKSRAGLSLEHHLAEIFKIFNLSFENQVIIEGNKKPDFIFPNVKSYEDPFFPVEKLIFLASKRTCKDRWRQILTEADRIKEKHLFTLQQGISAQQLQEMEDNKVKLVVPDSYKTFYPEKYRKNLMSLKEFTYFVHSKI